MVEAVTPLISLGAGVDARTAAPRLAFAEAGRAEISFPPGTTPLMVASFFGHSDVAERLLDRGADPRAADAAGTTALDHARAGSRLFAESRGSSYVELTARLVAALVVGQSRVSEGGAPRRQIVPHGPHRLHAPSSLSRGCPPLLLNPVETQRSS